MKCPHCLIAIHAEWSAWSVEEKGTSYLGAYEEYSKTDFHVESTLCPACKRLIFQLVIYSSLSEPVEAEIPPLDKIIVYPTSSSTIDRDPMRRKDYPVIGQFIPPLPRGRSPWRSTKDLPKIFGRRVRWSRPVKKPVPPLVGAASKAFYGRRRRLSQALWPKRSAKP